MKPAPKASRWAYLFSPLPKHTYSETIKITPSETNTYLFLVDRLNGNTRDGWTIPISDPEMIAALGYRRETISRARTGLAEKGLIIQVDHELRNKRIFYVAPPELVYLMKLCILAVLLREGRKDGLGIIRTACKRIVTTVCESAHNVVMTCSQNAPSVNAKKPDVESVSTPSSGSLTDLSSDISKESLSSPVPASEAKTVDKEKDSEVRERDFADLFYEEAMDKPNAIIDRQKRRRINRQCGQLMKDIASRVGVDHAQAVLIDAFQRVRGYDPYSFGIMSADYGERCIEAAISAHLAATTADKRTELTDTALNEVETCDTSDEPQTNAHTSNVKHSTRNPMSVEDRIRYHLAATKYQNHDHAVAILQRKDNTLTREMILSVLSAVDTERASKVPLLRRLSPHAVIDSVGRSVSEAADVMGALAHLRGMRTAPAMGG